MGCQPYREGELEVVAMAASPAWACLHKAPCTPQGVLTSAAANAFGRRHGSGTSQHNPWIPSAREAVPAVAEASAIRCAQWRGVFAGDSHGGHAAGW